MAGFGYRYRDFVGAIVQGHLVPVGIRVGVSGLDGGGTVRLGRRGHGCHAEVFRHQRDVVGHFRTEVGRNDDSAQREGSECRHGRGDAAVDPVARQGVSVCDPFEIEKRVSTVGDVLDGRAVQVHALRIHANAVGVLVAGLRHVLKHQGAATRTTDVIHGLFADGGNGAPDADGDLRDAAGGIHLHLVVELHAERDGLAGPVGIAGGGC